MEHRNVSPARRASLLHKFSSVTSPSDGVPQETTVVMNDSPNESEARRRELQGSRADARTPVREAAQRGASTAAEAAVYSPSGVTDGASPRRALPHPSYAPASPASPASILLQTSAASRLGETAGRSSSGPAVATDYADDGGVSSEVIMARKNVELYNMIVERDEELRELRQRARRLEAETDAMAATMDQRIEQRVRDLVERAAAEQNLAHQAAVQKLAQERAKMREELMVEAGRIDAMRQDVAAEAARAAALAEEAEQHHSGGSSASQPQQHGSSPGRPRSLSPASSRGRTSAGKGGTMDTSATVAAPQTHPLVLAAAGAVLLLCGLMFILCMAALSWRAMGSIANMGEGGGYDDAYDEADE